MTERELDVVLYGATGYTGRLIAEELAEHDAEIGLAGRDRSKLEALADELDGTQEVIVASVDDRPALEAMAERTAVVVSAAGPFKRLGPPVLDACLASQTAFVDITGEQGFLRAAHQRDALAKEAGVPVVDAMGFDVIPSDLAAYHATEGLDEVTRLDLAIDSRARLSGGTKRSMAASTGDGWYYEHGRFRRGPPGRFVRSFPTLEDDQDRIGVFIPWGDVVTAPRTTDARVVRTFFMMPEDRGRKMHLFWPLTDLISRIPFIDRLAERRAPGSNHGPSEEEREEASFRILGEATTPEGQTRRALVTGRDPYGLTGAAAARGALAIARGEVDEVGVLTPTQAFGPDWGPKALPEFELEVDVTDAA